MQAGRHTKGQYDKGILHAGRQIIQHEGVSGLFKGTSANLLMGGMLVDFDVEIDVSIVILSHGVGVLL